MKSLLFAAVASTGLFCSSAFAESDLDLIDPANLTATANSVSGNGSGSRKPQTAVDGAGMNEDGTHSNASANNIMWEPAEVSAQSPAWFRVDLGASYLLGGIKFWNFNWSGYTNRGAKDIEIYCTDDETTATLPSTSPIGYIRSYWTAIKTDYVLPQASGAASYAGADMLTFDYISARWVAILVKSHHGGGNGGLSEVRFYSHVLADGEPLLSDCTVNGVGGSLTVGGTLSASSAVLGSVAFDGGEGEYIQMDSETSEVGTFSVALPSALPEDKTYEVRARAVNGEYVAVSTAGTIYTGTPTVTLIKDGSEYGCQEGQVRIARASADPYPLEVNYSFSSSTQGAVAGKNWVQPTGKVTIPAGASSVIVPVVPIVDMGITEDIVVIVSLTAGHYQMATAQSANVTLANLSVPAGYNTWIAGSEGLASDDANWSAGHSPLATEDVLFDGNISNAKCEWDAQASHEVASWTQSAEFTGTVSFGTTFESFGKVFTNMVITGNATLSGGAWTHHDHRGCAVKTGCYHLSVTVGGDLTVGTGARISADGKGANATKNFWGANYGGAGGKFDEGRALFESYGQAFGSVTEPTDVGRSAGADGGYSGDDPVAWAGGAVYLKVGGTVTVNGPIRANGITQKGWNYSTGSGGSIYISAAEITGSSDIQANGGGSGGSNCNQCGSGGRIALITSAETLGLPISKVTVQGGSVYNYQAASGTIYVRTATSEHGSLYMKFNNVYGSYSYRPTYRFTTEIPSGQTWTFDDITFIGKGILRVPDGTTLSLPNGLGSVTGDDYEGGLILDGGVLNVPSQTPRCEGSWTMMVHSNAVVSSGLTLAGPRIGNLNLRRIAADFKPVSVKVKGSITLEGSSSLDLYGNTYLAGRIKQGESILSSGEFTAAAAQELGVTKVVDTSADLTGLVQIVNRGLQIFVR